MIKCLICLATILSIKCLANLGISIVPADHPHAGIMGYGDGNFHTNGEELVLKGILSPKSIVFDVGASYGNWSLMALQINPDIQLYSFEPLPKVFQQLKMNLNSSPALPYNMAFSNQLGRSQFYECDGAESEGSGFFLSPQLASKAKLIEVDTQTIDSFCAIHEISQIDYLKIDTEGGELRILQGAASMLMNHRIIALQFEYGGTYPNAHITLKEVIQFLTQAGYAIFRMSSSGIINIAQWDNSLENFQYANYFAVIQSMIPDLDLVQITPAR